MLISDRRRRRRSARSSALLTDSRGINVAIVVERQRGNFFFGRAVQHEAFARGRNTVHQATAIGAGNQFPLRVERQHADMSLIALEENRVLAFGRDLVDLTVIAGRDEKISRLIESEIPDVFCAGREILRRTPGRIQRRLIGIFLRIISRSSLASVMQQCPVPACARSCRPCHRAQ